jgi:hypothetical protein
MVGNDSNTAEGKDADIVFKEADSRGVERDSWLSIPVLFA